MSNDEQGRPRSGAEPSLNPDAPSRSQATPEPEAATPPEQPSSAPPEPPVSHPQSDAAPKPRRLVGFAKRKAVQLVAVGILGAVLGGGVVALTGGDHHDRPYREAAGPDRHGDGARGDRWSRWFEREWHRLERPGPGSPIEPGR